jgi:DNA primase
VTQLDFAAIRARIPIRRVLELIGYRAVSHRGPQWRGPCPICSTAAANTNPAANTNQRCFSVHIDRHLFQCFACRRAGNQLDLWAHISGLSLHPATLDLCRRLGIEPIKPSNPQPPNHR